MSDYLKMFQQYPAREIPEWRMPTVSVHYKECMAVAGPFFGAGGYNICLARRQVYGGDLHRTLRHRFILVAQGRMEIKMDKKVYIVEPNDLVCTPAGTLTQRKALEPTEWIYIDINDEPLWNPLKKAGPSVRQYESASLMYILVKEIIDAMHSQDLYSMKCSYENAGTLVTLLERELRHYSKEWKPKRTDDMIDLIDRIRKAPGQTWNRSVLARTLGMSERNLTLIFDQVFGTSPAKMITRIRMEHAMAMLKETNDSVDTIGEVVGYENSVSFFRAFKKYVGMPPGAYRNEVME